MRSNSPARAPSTAEPAPIGRKLAWRLQDPQLILDPPASLRLVLDAEQQFDVPVK